MHVLCVLKSGGEYAPKHAARLYDQFLRHAPLGTEFLCLTDMLAEVEALHVPCAALAHDWPGSPARVKRFDIWPGYWSKMEIYRVPGPCLYLDLDVTIVASLGLLLDVARETEFCTCADFWVDGPHGINSSVVGWSGDVSSLYREFAEAPQAHMDVYQTMENWGDQGFVRDHWRGPRALWQELEPGAIVSYKLGVLKRESLAGMIVCVSHGKPKPWEQGGADAWLRQNGKLE